MAIYIHPDFQRCGAGSALLHEISHIKKEQGYTKLVLWTIKKGSSLGFYKKHCMKQSEDIEEKIWKFNIPIICLEKDL